MRQTTRCYLLRVCELRCNHIACICCGNVFVHVYYSVNVHCCTCVCITMSVMQLYQHVWCDCSTIIHLHLRSNTWTLARRASTGESDYRTYTCVLSSKGYNTRIRTPPHVHDLYTTCAALSVNSALPSAGQMSMPPEQLRRNHGSRPVQQTFAR